MTLSIYVPELYGAGRAENDCSWEKRRGSLMAASSSMLG
jgi:hypothetical protein